jgi:hypothetical protein
MRLHARCSKGAAPARKHQCTRCTEQLTLALAHSKCKGTCIWTAAKKPNTDAAGDQYHCLTKYYVSKAADNSRNPPAQRRGTVNALSTPLLCRCCYKRDRTHILTPMRLLPIALLDAAVDNCRNAPGLCAYTSTRQRLHEALQLQCPAMTFRN